MTRAESACNGQTLQARNRRFEALKRGSHDYCLAVVADGTEDYYLALGEKPGRWLGRGALTLQLDEHVEAEQLLRVLAGADPHTGARFASHPARRVPGFDLTFRAPKSVSLLWGLSDRQVAAQVAAAHDAAVDAAIGYLERAAGYTRRRGGGVQRVKVEGFVAADFRHRTSRRAIRCCTPTCWSPTSPALLTMGYGAPWTPS